MKVPFNDLTSLHQSMEPAISNAIHSVIEQAAFVCGPEVFQFEQELAAYCGGGYGVGCGNGTDALLLSLRALRIGAGDEVIVPAQSFIATVEPVIHVGAKPVFVDIDSDSYCIDPAKVEDAISAKTKAIIAVHLYGVPCDMAALRDIASRHNLALIEDCAQAIGAQRDGQKVGLCADIAAFSFYPGKNLGAFGDAGAVLSNNKHLAEMVAMLSNHGRAQGRDGVFAKYNHQIIGFNSRLDNIQAAILRVKLRFLDEQTERRRKFAEMYHELLHNFVKTPSPLYHQNSVYHLYVIEVENRNNVLEALQKRGVGCAVHYPDPLHAHKPVRDFVGDLRGQFPIAERLARNSLSLPMHPYLTEDQVSYVAECVKESL